MSYININKKEFLNWVENIHNKELNENFSFNIDDYKNLSIEELRNIRTDIGRALQKNENEITLLSKSPEGINIKDATCFLQMPQEIIDHVKTWDVIQKSPYSCSLYSDKNIGWNFKPDGCYSVSDHWNFFLRGKYHKITDKMVINDTHITLCKFNASIKPTDGYLIKKRIKQGEFTEEQAAKIHNTEGVWEVILSLPKDSTKIKQIEKLRKDKTELKSLLKQLRELHSHKNEPIVMKNIQSFDNYNKEIVEKKSEDGNVKIFNKQKDIIIAKNKEYNFEPIPAKFKDKDPNYDIVISKKIEIGDKNPIKKFREWDSKYWRKAKNRKQKYEPKSKQ